MLNLLDTISFCIITSTCLGGLRLGVIRLSLSNLSFILAFFLSSILFIPCKNIIDEYVPSKLISQIVAASSSYMISLILCGIFFKQIKLFIRPLCDGFLDKLLGLLLGFINGITISIIIFLFLIFFTTKQAKEDNKQITSLNLHQFASTSLNAKYPKWLQDSFTSQAAKTLLGYVVNIPWTSDLLKKINLDIDFFGDRKNKKN